MKHYVVIARLEHLGAPPMPVAAFWFLWPARVFADFATMVTGLPCEVR